MSVITSLTNQTIVLPGTVPAQNTWPIESGAPNALAAAVNPAWAQQNWYVDYLRGKDSNDGLTPSTAVKTVMGGVVARWETISPLLFNTTTIHILNSEPPDSEAIALSPTMLSGSFSLQGEPVATSGTLLSVTAKNRSANQPLEITSSLTLSSGDYVRNVTPGKESIARVRTVSTSSVMTQPVTLLSVSDDPYSAAEVDTWAPGDSVEVFRPFDLNVTHFAPVIASSSSSSQAWIRMINLLAPSADDRTLSAPQSSAPQVVYCCDVSVSLTSPYAVIIGSALLGSAFLSGQTYIFGGMVGSAANVSLWSEAGVGGDLAIESGGSLFGVGIDNNIGNLEIEGVFQVDGFIVFFETLWGSGEITVGGTLWAELGTPWADSVFVPTIFLQGLAVGSSFNTTSNTWTSGIAVTPANIDANHGLQDVRSGARVF
jgi:hypothetical protein